MAVEKQYAIIMAGGQGERFWPLSTSRRPKQLLALAGGKPLLLQSLERLEGIIPPEQTIIVTSESLVRPIREMLGEGSPVAILGEPLGRDTAAAITAGAAWIRRHEPHAVLCVLTADHVIGDLSVFRQTLQTAMNLCATQNILMTIGISPAAPSSAYGYIEMGDLWAQQDGIAFHQARRFVEKPDEKTAEAYLATGRYVWNSGMFIWSLPALAQALQQYRPALADCLARWSRCASDADFCEMLRKDFPRLEKISVDYALMEKADNIVVCKGTFSWDDVGSWPALKAYLPNDACQNAVAGHMEAWDSADNIVYSQNHLTALVGVKELIVVQAEGVTLVCHKSRSQDLKKLLANIKSSGKWDHLL